MVSPQLSTNSPAVSVPAVGNLSSPFRDLSRAFDLPETLSSAAAVERIGFTPSVAREIFNRCNRSDVNDDPDELMPFVLGHVLYLNDPNIRNMEPNAALTLVGLTDKIRNAILAPEHEQVFRTESLLYWVRDTLDTNYYTLEKLMELRKAREEKILDSKSTIFKNQKLPEEEVEYDDGPLVTTKLTGVESEEERWSGDLFKIFTPSKDTCHHLEEHVKLFKGMAPPAIIDFIKDDGSINMGSISTNQGDFNGNSLARNFSPEYETAEKYRLYAAHRSEFAETWTIQILAPESDIKTLNKEELFYSPEWKEFVWTCRRSKSVPKDLEKYANAHLLICHICVPPRPAGWIKKEQFLESLTEDTVMCNGSRKATQWVFNAEVAHQFEMERKGNLRVEIHPPVILQGGSMKELDII